MWRNFARSGYDAGGRRACVIAVPVRIYAFLVFRVWSGRPESYIRTVGEMSAQRFGRRGALDFMSRQATKRTPLRLSVRFALLLGLLLVLAAAGAARAETALPATEPVVQSDPATAPT